MEKPKSLKVTPEVWEAIKSDLQKEYYQKMGKTMRQLKIGKKNKVSETVVYNVDNTETYLDYLKAYAPASIAWYLDEEPQNEEESVEEERIVKVPMYKLVRIMIHDMTQELHIDFLQSEVKFYKRMSQLFFFFWLLNIVITIAFSFWR